MTKKAHTNASDLLALAFYSIGMNSLSLDTRRWNPGGLRIKSMRMPATNAIYLFKQDWGIARPGGVGVSGILDFSNFPGFSIFGDG